MKVDSYLPYVTIGFLTPAVFVVWAQPFGKDGVLLVAWQAFALGVFGLSALLSSGNSRIINQPKTADQKANKSVEKI